MRQVYHQIWPGTSISQAHSPSQVHHQIWPRIRKAWGWLQRKYIINYDSGSQSQKASTKASKSPHLTQDYNFKTQFALDILGMPQGTYIASKSSILTLYHNLKKHLPRQVNHHIWHWIAISRHSSGLTSWARHEANISSDLTGDQHLTSA